MHNVPAVNAHKGRTGDFVTDAVDYADALFNHRTRHLWGLPSFSVEDERQDWICYVLSRVALGSYDPTKGTLSTWLANGVWLTWWTRGAKKRIARSEHERPYDATPGALDDMVKAGTMHRDWFSPYVGRVTEEAPRSLDLGEAQKYVDMLPERIRDSVVAHLADGASIDCVATRNGHAWKTVWRHVKQAREIWAREVAA